MLTENGGCPSKPPDIKIQRKKFTMSRTSPLIALVGSIYPDGGIYGLRNGYMQSVLAAGGTPFLLPVGADDAALNELLAVADGLLVTGGADVDPACYGQVRKPLCGKAWPERDAIDRLMINHALAAHKPLLGICRGMQALNVFTGGTLVQDIESTIRTTTHHSQKEDYRVTTHRVRSTQNRFFEALAGSPEIAVNSHHHQCVDRPGRNVRIIARSLTDDVPEAMVVTSEPFCVGIQWHPEMLSAEHPEALSIFKAFVAACRGEFPTVPVTD